MILALTATAFAVDLDVELTTPSGEVRSLTFHDVEASAPPTFQVEMRGATVTVTLAVTPSNDTWIVAANLAELDKRGRPKLISAPRVTVRANEEGTVKQGARVPVPGTNPVEYREEAWQLNVLVRPT